MSKPTISLHNLIAVRSAMTGRSRSYPKSTDPEVLHRYRVMVDALDLLGGHRPEITNNQKVAVAGFLEVDGKVLLARRAMTKTIAPGLLHLPGGHVEPGESLYTALMREFQEEFCLDVGVGDLVHIFEYANDDIKTTGFVFFVTASTPLNLQFDQKDNSEVLWACRADLDQLFTDKSDHNFVAAEKAFALLSHS